MPGKRLFSYLIALVVLGACGAVSPWQAPHYQEHPLAGRIWNVAEARFADKAELIAALVSADFILLGETHDNPDHHLLQAEIVSAVAGAGRRPMIAFEMFDMTQQQALAEHLKTSPEDSAGIAEAVGWRKSGWPDWQLYRPIAAAALHAGLEIRPANMSRAQARGLAQHGLEGAEPDFIAGLGLDVALPAEQQENVRQEIDDAHCGYAPAEMIDAMAFAQFARDAHMARTLNSGAKEDGAILIAGAGHTRNDRAVPFHLRRMAPGRSILSLAFLEVSEGAPSPPAYAAPFNSQSLPFDYVWFTPRVDIRDACKRFEEQLKKMQEGKAAAKKQL